jgi:hypothetical protein
VIENKSNQELGAEQSDWWCYASYSVYSSMPLQGCVWKCRKNETYTACNWLVEGHKSSVSETRFNTQIKENKGPHPSLSKKKKGQHPYLIIK